MLDAQTRTRLIFISNVAQGNTSLSISQRHTTLKGQRLTLLRPESVLVLSVTKYTSESIPNSYNLYEIIDKTRIFESPPNQVEKLLSTCRFRPLYIPLQVL